MNSRRVNWRTAGASVCIIRVLFGSDGLECSEKPECFVCGDPMKDGKLRGGLLFEPGSIGKELSLSRKRDEIGTEVTRN